MLKKWDCFQYIWEKSKTIQELNKKFISWLNSFVKHTLLSIYDYNLICPHFTKKDMVYNNIEIVIFLVNLYFNNVNEPKTMSYKQTHLKIIKNLIRHKINLKSIKKYIVEYKLIDKKYIVTNFEKDNSLFCEICSFGSIDYINWYLEYVPVLTTLITNSSKYNLLERACLSGNLETARYVFDLIKLSGLEVDKLMLQRILYGLIDKSIADERWNLSKLSKLSQGGYDYNDKKDYDTIIKELINMNVKPTRSGQYTEYYSNIRMIR
jgi:hypothetical protein